MFEIVAKDSPEDFRMLKIYNYKRSESAPETLESFFSSREKRVPQKSLS